MTKVSFKHTIRNYSELKMSFWQRLQILFGKKIEVQFVTWLEHDPGVYGIADIWTSIGRTDLYTVEEPNSFEYPYFYERALPTEAGVITKM